MTRSFLSTKRRWNNAATSSNEVLFNSVAPFSKRPCRAQVEDFQSIKLSSSNEKTKRWAPIVSSADTNDDSNRWESAGNCIPLKQIEVATKHPNSYQERVEREIIRVMASGHARFTVQDPVERKLQDLIRESIQDAIQQQQNDSRYCRHQQACEEETMDELMDLETTQHNPVNKPRMLTLRSKSLSKTPDPMDCSPI